MPLRRFGVLALLLFEIGFPAAFGPARTISRLPGDPIAQCAEGIHLFNEGRASEARPLLEAGFQARAEAPFPDANLLGLCAVSLGVLRFGDYDWDGALEAFQVSLQVFRQNGNRELEGVTLDNLGQVYAIRRETAQALACYQQSLEIWRQLRRLDSEAETLHRIGLAHEGQGNFRKAQEAYQQALEIQRQVGFWAQAGRSLNSLGRIQQALGNYAEAMEAFERALALARDVEDRATEGQTLSNIGDCYNYLGRYASALEYYQQALSIQRSLGNRADLVLTLNGLGVVYWRQGRLDESLEHFRQSLELARQVDNRKGAAAALHNAGMVHFSQGLHAQALESLQRALELYVGMGDQAGEASALNNLGLVRLAQGDAAGALEDIRRSLEIRREIGDRAGEGWSLGGLCRAFIDQGRYGEAAEACNQALASQRAIGNAAGEGETLILLGIISQAGGEPEQALAYYEQAMDVLEGVRAAAGSEAGRSAFIAQYAGLYDRAIQLYHAQGNDAAAFFTSERGRARAFLDGLSSGTIELSEGASAALLAREQETYLALQAARSALAEALRSEDPELIAELEGQVDRNEQAHQAALQAIQELGSQLASLAPGPGALLDLPAVQRLLDERTTLLSFWALEEGVLAFLVTRSGFEAIDLPISREELLEQVSALRDFHNLDLAYPRSARILYEALVAPLEGALDTPHLAIVPHGVLHYLPFAALTDGDGFLIDDVAISTLPSASALPYVKANAADREFGAPLILGNPQTGDASFPPLVFAEQEALSLGSLFGVQPLVGAAATESALRRGAPQAGALHVASHAGFNPANPLYSALALAPDGQNDGRLYVHEIYGLDLRRVDLVVLSACKTQLGELSAGDELVGMTRALFFAGAPSVVASLWSVDDRSTSMLMTRFYRHLQEGMGKAEALRQAQREVRQEYPHPYFWAGFVLAGEAGGGEALRPMAAPAAATVAAPDGPSAGAAETGWPWIVGASLAVALAILLIRWRLRRAR